MNKISLVVLCCAAVIAGGIYLTGTRDAHQSVLSPAEEAVVRMERADVSVPDIGTGVTLHNGTSRFELSPGADAPGVITLQDTKALVWEGSDRTDVVGLFSVAPGGSGTFYYLILFEDKDGKLVQRSYALLGDRVRVEDMRLRIVENEQVDYEIAVDMLVRHSNEPFAAHPTVASSTTVLVKEGQFLHN